MKTIEPVSIWVNGAVKEATKLNLYVVNDDLKSFCTFYYALMKETENPVVPGIPNPSAPEETPVPAPQPTYTYEMLAQGNLTMGGEEYDNWNADEDINTAAYTWAASKLGLTLV